VLERYLRRGGVPKFGETTERQIITVNVVARNGEQSTEMRELRSTTKTATYLTWLELL